VPLRAIGAATVRTPGSRSTTGPDPSRAPWRTLLQKLVVDFSQWKTKAFEVSRAVDYLNEPRHRAGDGTLVGVQHRDIKPHNIR
jgi:hypothetical protein